MSLFKILDSQNRLFVLARQGKRLPSWYVGVLITLVIVIALPILGDVLTPAQVTQLAMSTNPIESALGLLTSIIIVFGLRNLFLAGWIRFVEKRPFWTIGFERRKALPMYLRGMLVGILMYTTAMGITALTGTVSFQGGVQGQAGLGVLGGILLALVGFMIQGGSEEINYRGWLAFATGARYRPVVGVLLSALLFSFGHLPGLISGGLTAPTIIGIISLMVITVFFCLYALLEKSLWGICGVHAAWNWTEGNILSTSVSGHANAGGFLTKLVFHGPDWISGGAFGPEAGLPVLVVLLVSIGLLLVLARFRRSARTEWSSSSSMPESILQK